jgi:hypothetical protein
MHLVLGVGGLHAQPQQSAQENQYVDCALCCMVLMELDPWQDNEEV